MRSTLTGSWSPACRSFGEVCDTLIVPHSKWWKRGDTQQIYLSIDRSVISITKAGLSQLQILLWGSRLHLTPATSSVFHWCGVMPCIEQPVPSALTVLLFPNDAQRNTCHCPQPGSNSVKDDASEVREAQTCCVQTPQESGSLPGECRIHQLPHSDVPGLCRLTQTWLYH